MATGMNNAAEHLRTQSGDQSENLRVAVCGSFKDPKTRLLIFRDIDDVAADGYELMVDPQGWLWSHGTRLNVGSGK